VQVEFVSLGILFGQNFKILFQAESDYQITKKHIRNLYKPIINVLIKVYL
jgi:hypothetical protein